MALNYQELNIDVLVLSGRKFREMDKNEAEILEALKKESIVIWEKAKGDTVVINGKKYKVTPINN